MPGSETGAWTGSERRDEQSRRRVVQRFYREYQELPGMSLTANQAARLFALRPDVCFRVFEELVRKGVLKRQWEGQYVARKANT